MPAALSTARCRWPAFATDGGVHPTAQIQASHAAAAIAANATAAVFDNLGEVYEALSSVLSVSPVPAAETTSYSSRRRSKSPRASASLTETALALPEVGAPQQGRLVATA